MSSIQLNGSKVTVAGLGVTGVALVPFLTAQGAKVTVSDSRQPHELLSELERIAHCSPQLDLGGHSEAVFRNADLIIVSPGVPLTIPALLEARKRGVPVIGELELAYRNLKRPMVAVTGSNGKSTTVELTAHLLRSGGISACVAGNIGTPLIQYVMEGQREEIVVVEASSFQLETVDTFRPDWGVLLNVSPDHLDRYPDLKAYATAKAALFRKQQPKDMAILNLDDVFARRLGGRIKSRLRFFSQTTSVDKGAFLQGNTVVLVENGHRDEVSLRHVRLKGRHNLENVMAALLVARDLGVSVENMEKGLNTFTAPPHRMQLVARIRGVDYYDDSKGTNVGAVAAALRGFDQQVVLILGGRDKNSDFRILNQPIKEKARAVVIFGEAKEAIYRAVNGAAPAYAVHDLREAVEKSYELAQEGDAVLLSPACASFDMFQNYAHRGRVFQELVKELESYG
jgi:UDP-N-acetylmuramoylalanine--D-glutamate ligase